MANHCILLTHEAIECKPDHGFIFFAELFRLGDRFQSFGLCGYAVIEFRTHGTMNADFQNADDVEDFCKAAVTVFTSDVPKISALRKVVVELATMNFGVLKKDEAFQHALDEDVPTLAIAVAKKFSRDPMHEVV